VKILVHLAAAVCTVALIAQSAPAFSQASSTNNQTEIRQLLARWEKAFHAKDVAGVMAVYGAGASVVAFDVVPPLRIVGAEPYRKNYEEFFAMYEGPLDVEFRELRIVAGNEVAFLHCLERISGTLKGGQKSEIWARVTSGLRKTKGKWLIVHDHVSVPADFDSGKAALDLKP
jgi:uncharacterized protein (TIGR02246 family)